MSCEAPHWIDARADPNVKSGCTLMRCKADWLEIWTLNHGPSQSQTFLSCNNIKVSGLLTITLRSPLKIKAIKTVI